jgi:hypothetical protein
MKQLHLKIKLFSNMKNYIIAACLMFLALFAGQTQVQAQGYEKGNKLLSAGLGFGYYYAGGLTLSANMEFGVSDLISVGPYFGFTRWSYLSFVNYTFLDFGLRGSAHLGEVLDIGSDKFDPYVGLMLGYLTSSYRIDGVSSGLFSDVYAGGLRYGGHLGALLLQ